MLPLQSIRVLDLSRLLPGPFCTMLLADFGAEVIKIEAPDLGDYARQYEPKIDENSVMFHSLNRNKKSVTLDLKTDEGKDQFFQMVGKADVVVESFRPGVMKRLGLDFPVLEKINPRLIYCAISGYGQTGPYAEMPGHDINYISFAGLLELMGKRMENRLYQPFKLLILPVGLIRQLRVFYLHYWSGKSPEKGNLSIFP